MPDSDITATLRAVDQNFSSTFQAAQAAVQNFASQASASGKSASDAYQQMADFAKRAATPPGNEFKNWTDLLKESFTGLREAFEGFSFDRPTLAVAGIGNVLKNTLGPMGELIGIAAAAGFAMVEFGRHTAEASEALVNMHLQTGMAVDTLKMWQAAASTVGASGDAIGSAVARMQMRFAELANAGSGASKQLEGALKQLHLSMTDLEDPTKALLKVGEQLNAAMEGTGNYSLIAGEATKVFGRNFRELIPTVEEAARHQQEYADEVARYGMTDYQTVRAQETAEALHGLGRAWSELRDQLGSLVMPILEKLVVGTTDLLHAIDLLFKGINVGITTIKGLVEELGDWAKNLSVVKTAIDDVYGAWEKLKGIVEKGINFVMRTPEGKDVVTAITDAKKIIEDAYARGSKLTPEESGKVKPLSGGNAPVGGPGLTPGEQEALIAAQAKTAEAQIAIKEAHVKRSYELGQIGEISELQQLQTFENAKYEIQRNSLAQQEAAAKAGDKPKIAQEILTLEATHQKSIIDNETKIQKLKHDNALQDLKDISEKTTNELALANVRLTTEKSIGDKLLALHEAQVKALGGQDFELGAERARLSEQALIAEQVNDAKIYAAKRLLFDQEMTGLDTLSKEYVKFSDERDKLDQDYLKSKIEMDAKIAESGLDLQAQQLDIAQKVADAWHTAMSSVTQDIDKSIDMAFTRGHKRVEEFNSFLRTQTLDLIKQVTTGLLFGGKEKTAAGFVGGQFGLSGVLFGPGGLEGMLSKGLGVGPGGLLGMLFRGTTGIGQEATLQTAGVALNAAGIKLLEAAVALGRPGNIGGTGGINLGGGVTGTSWENRIGGTPLSPVSSGAGAGGGGIFSELFSGIKSLGSMISSSLTSGASSLMSGLSGAFSGGASTLTSALGSAFSGGASLLSSIFGALGGGGGGGGLGSILSLASTVAPFFLERGGIIPSAESGMFVVPSAQAGMTVDRKGGTLSVLHPREMVLPAHLSEGIQSMINSGNSTGSPAFNMGGVHIHAIDSKDFYAHLEEHADAIGDILYSRIRQFGYIRRV